MAMEHEISGTKKFSFFDVTGRYVCSLYNTDIRNLKWEMFPLLVPNNRYVVISFVDEYDTVESVGMLHLWREESPEQIISDGYDLRDGKYELCIHGFTTDPMVIQVSDVPLIQVVKKFCEMGCTVYCTTTGHEMMYQAAKSKIVSDINSMVD